MACALFLPLSAAFGGAHPPRRVALIQQYSVGEFHQQLREGVRKRAEVAARHHIVHIVVC